MTDTQIDPKIAIDLAQRAQDQAVRKIAAMTAFPILVNLKAQKMPNGTMVPRSVQGSGLLKIEYYAAKAMQGILGAPQNQLTDPKDIATASVKCAMALMEELAKIEEVNYGDKPNGKNGSPGKVS